MTDEQYYSDQTNWGNYQYILLSQIIDDIMANMDDDSYISNTPRHKVLYHAKRGIRELFYDVMNEIKSIEIELSPTLKVIFPTDYVSWVRVSWVDDKGILHPMAQDARMSVARAYLQDNDFDLLYDNDGCVLEGTGKRDSVQSQQVNLLDYNSYLLNNDYYTPFFPNADLSKSFNNGKFIVNKQDGCFEFGSECNSKNIVLEYISDGLYTGTCGGQESDIKINKMAEEALLDYVYYEIVNSKRSAPAIEKQMAKKKYYNSRRVAKSRINTIRLDDIKQASKGSSVWIKGPYG